MICPKNPSLLDQWIINKLSSRLTNIEKAMDNYEFGIANKEIYNFVYNEFASVYIELSKVDIKNSQATQKTLMFVFIALLKMLHPYIPFVSEHIYQSFFSTKSLLNQEYPNFSNFKKSHIEEIDILNELILKIRQIRAEKNIAKSKEIKIATNLGSEYEKLFANYCQKLVNCHFVKREKNWDAIPFAKGEIYINFKDYINEKEAKSFLNSQLEKVNTQITHLEKKLSNKNYVAKAPQNIVEYDKNKLNELKQNKIKLEEEVKK